jgi:transposase
MRRKKTDRIDVLKLMAHLVRYHRGEQQVWSVVHVPAPEAEDARRPHREIQRLSKERTAHSNRIRSLLALQGIRIGTILSLGEKLERLRCPNGLELPQNLKNELLREYQRYQLACRQIKELEDTKRVLVREANSENDKKVKQLMSLYGVGPRGADVLVYEFFGWRKFNNRREVAAAVGLTPTPYQSGEQNLDQGISKAGNRRVRSLMVELAWHWLRYQPQSALSMWYVKRFSVAKSRSRRIGIIAIARRLLIIFWRFLEQGVIPEGVRFKTA